MPIPLDTIAALRPGPELDRLVHTIVLRLPEESRNDLPCYSETTGALVVLGVVPIEVGRYSESDPEFTHERPYYGRFTVGPIQNVQTYLFKCATPEVALCKAALAYRSITDPQKP